MRRGKNLGRGRRIRGNFGLGRFGGVFGTFFLGVRVTVNFLSLRDWGTGSFN